MDALDVFIEAVSCAFDEICAAAKEKIRCACGVDDAEIFFLCGGTQTNQIVISTILRPYEGVIAAATGHVNVHEAGAIEYSGHKVLPLPAHQGKIDPEELRSFLKAFRENPDREHMVFPGMVYISYPTEYGTLYSAQELNAVSGICREYGIPLFIDGARLGYGLAASKELTMRDIAALSDVFYIGGTKCGAMLGEAVVFPKHLVDGFFTIIKQSGALLAKGWIAGAQFDALFSNDLYLRCGRNAIDLAEQLKAALKEKGYSFYLESPTNQQFIILEKKKKKKLEEKIIFSFWEKYDENHTVVRLATSWSTTETDLKELLEMM